MGTVITFENKKGGSGKTQTCLNLGLTLNSLEGKSILFIDLDESNTLSNYFLEEKVEKDLLKAFENNDINSNIIKFTNNVSLLKVPFDFDLDIFLSKAEAKADSQLKRLIKPIINNYDYILIDSRPLRSTTVTNAVEASDMVIIPFQPSLDVETLSRATIKLCNELDKPSYLLRENWSDNTTVSKQILPIIEENLKKQPNTKLLNTVIRHSQEIVNNYSWNRSIVDRKSAVRNDFEELAKEIENIIDKKEGLENA